MTRVLVSIGCDEYEGLSELRGAVIDAERIFQLLTDPDRGDYDPQRSLLLKSPTLNEVRQAIQQTLFASGTRITTFTFFFAGHGGVKAGSYYLCLRDSVLDMLSVSALNLSDLFITLNEARPFQSNIILDACESGGLVGDLAALLKPELLGGSGTPGITIFGSSASDEYAADTPDGGVATSNLIEIIRGDEVLQTVRPHLDLVEIGRTVSMRMAALSKGQTPALWGLNLFGESAFCKNPHFAQTSAPALYSAGTLPETPELLEAIQDRAEGLWREYFTLTTAPNPRRLYELTDEICDVLEPVPSTSARFMAGVAPTLAAQAAKSPDPFVEAETLACCCLPLLSRTKTDPAAQEGIATIACRVHEAVSRALEDALELAKDPHLSLLSPSGGFSDLYYLPLRLTKLLGWGGAQLISQAWLGGVNTKDSSVIQELAELVKDKYGPSLVAVSDCQTPYLVSFFHACELMNWDELAEDVLGFFFNSFATESGRIARSDLPPDHVLAFLRQRAKKGTSASPELLAQPVEFLAALLLAADTFSLDDVVDPHMKELDHLSFNVFIPYDHSQSASEIIRDGRNLSFQIGHGIWRVNHFKNEINRLSQGIYSNDPSLNTLAVKIGALYASLLFPDRAPWFITLLNRSGC